MQGTGIIELRPGFEHNEDNDGAAPELDFDFDLDAAIAEASRAAEIDLDPSADPAKKDEDLTAFLTESISKAAEEAQGPEKEAGQPGEVASAAESASKATMMALERIQGNNEDLKVLPQGHQPHCEIPFSSYNIYLPVLTGEQYNRTYLRKPRINNISLNNTILTHNTASSLTKAIELQATTFRRIRAIRPPHYMREHGKLPPRGPLRRLVGKARILRDGPGALKRKRPL